jgi:hypothetical protein
MQAKLAKSKDSVSFSPFSRECRSTDTRRSSAAMQAIAPKAANSRRFFPNRKINVTHLILLLPSAESASNKSSLQQTMKGWKGAIGVLSGRVVVLECMRASVET